MNWRLAALIVVAAFACASGLRAAENKKDLRALLEQSVKQTCEEFSAQGLKPVQVAVTLIDERFSEAASRADYRGDTRIYPASVIKLFFLAYAHQRMEDGRLTDTLELRRGLRDMIVDSYNEATSYVVDAITGTTSGPELPASELKTWHEQRAVVTQYFEQRGYKNTAAQRKPWGEGPYGREKQDASANAPARNFLSTNDTARLLDEMANGRCVTAERSAQMMALLARDPFAKNADPESQALAFTGGALSPGMKLWSKAGWTSQVRHDAAIIEFPAGGRIILVIFTEGPEHANNRAIIPALAKRILASL